MTSLTVAGTRILTPAEYHTLLNAIPKPHHRTMFLVCFWSGMRYIEVQRLHANPDWWSPERRSIHIPESGCRKGARRVLERLITPTPSPLESELSQFFQNDAPPVQKVWNHNLQRWMQRAGLDPDGISSKTTRKSFEAWLITARVPFDEVCLRQGHDQLSPLMYYLKLAFTKQETEEIKRMVKSYVYRTNLECIHCESNDVKKTGKQIYGKGLYQIIKCNKCGGSTILNKTNLDENDGEIRTPSEGYCVVDGVQCRYYEFNIKYNQHCVDCTGPRPDILTDV